MIFSLLWIWAVIKIQNLFDVFIVHPTRKWILPWLAHWCSPPIPSTVQSDGTLVYVSIFKATFILSLNVLASVSCSWCWYFVDFVWNHRTNSTMSLLTLNLCRRQSSLITLHCFCYQWFTWDAVILYVWRRLCGKFIYTYINIYILSWLNGFSQLPFHTDLQIASLSITT